MLKGLSIKKGTTGIAVEVGENDIAKANKLLDWLADAPVEAKPRRVEKSDFTRGR